MGNRSSIGFRNDTYLGKLIFIGEIILIFINVAMAAYHADLIKDGRRINHALWGGLYLAVAGLFSWLNHSWILLIASLFIRKVFFDLSLNLFRELPLFYVSSDPESMIDKWHNKHFGKNSELYMVIYFLVIVFLNILLLSKV